MPNRLIEKYVEVVRMDGINTLKSVTIGTRGATSSASLTVGSGGISSTGSVTTGPQVVKITNSVAVNTTATLTAAQILSGYITTTSAAAVTMTLPTGTLLGTAVGAIQGTAILFYVDNTAGANTVTMAVATNGVLSAAAVAGSSAGAGLLTIPSGVTGVAEFTIVFSSPTAYVWTRTA